MSATSAPPSLQPVPVQADGQGWLASPWRFWLALTLLITAGLVRSAVATSKDALQIDEAWHTVAGVSYARTGDFRLNPEHPPLVKLWVGASMPESKFRLAPFRAMDDKAGEREFIDDVFYIDSDPQVAQHYMRLSMLAFHGLALLLLGWALRRTVGAPLTLVSIAVLLVDPTVAAHLPVVLTDLPLTLLAAASILFSFIAFTSWRALDLALAALALGLALVSKHSAIPVGIATVPFGLVMIWLTRKVRTEVSVSRRFAGLAGVLLGAYLCMWAFYGFRFDESPHRQIAQVVASVETEQGKDGAALPTFNRSIEDKIADLNSPGYRKLLELALSLRALPRAYLWGLADIVRAGVEGRQDTMYVYGKLVYGATPWYFFPAVLTAKLPLGVIALALLGSVLLARRSTPSGWLGPALALLCWGGFFMLFVMRGNSGYAGVRHVVPVFPVVALLAAVPICLVLQRRLNRPAVQLTIAAATLATVISVLPMWRPWEYYNELAGGTRDAWRYFADDGLENGQRGKEIAAYYDAYLRGTNEPAYDFYGLYDNEKKAYRLKFSEISDDKTDSDVLTGTVFVNTRWLGERPLYDYAVFRAAKPVARFGNVLVMRGRFQIPWLRAERRLSLFYQAVAPGKRDPDRAERLLSEITSIYPEDYQASFELGNLLLARGAIEPAIHAYSLSRKHAPIGDGIVQVLSRQIDALASAGGHASPLRNPWLE